MTAQSTFTCPAWPTITVAGEDGLPRRVSRWAKLFAIMRWQRSRSGIRTSSPTEELALDYEAERTNPALHTQHVAVSDNGAVRHHGIGCRGGLNASEQIPIVNNV